ncbi:uncharacterized protein LOC110610261 isoform X3 [Manihot esculenta]|uniref:uncharacterized protein LOC110610261 isoform X3 n=1 Tax=Manihot esculenta TaxID=3983 RepID=UPI001CC54FA7|nr:uncharacterized protein LOC110610261 isoform X3 [Manihot esculenta]
MSFLENWFHDINGYGFQNGYFNSQSVLDLNTLASKGRETSFLDLGLHMFQHLGCLIGINPKIGTQKRLPNAKPLQTKIKPIAMLDTVQEIAIYIHRFHNLDLFQQGWYQIKISVRWEDNAYTSLGSPARVVQCEPPDLGSDNTCGVWKIDDADNSFSTQPFRIKYAKQDILLSIMISFNLPLGECKGPSTSAVILKFELLQAPASENGLELLAHLDASSVAVHEFRIPPKALLGLHSYCPVHFDAFHAVLVDVSVHASLLKASSYMKVSSDSCSHEDVAGKQIDRSNQSLGQVASVDMKQIMLVKALSVARDTLLEELQKLSKAIDQAIDLTDFSKTNNEEMFDSILRPNLGTVDGEVSGQGKPKNVLEKSSSIADFQSDVLPYTLSEDTVVKIFHSLGVQLSDLWSTFLQFHRVNKTKILEFLSTKWAEDRRAEWSIWMVCSKVEMPHHYISRRNKDFSHPTVPKRVASLWKLPDDPVQTLATRAELHRRSIAQMKINNQSIQDMHIFGDPLRIPIIIVERVMNAPRRALSEHSYFRNVDLIDSPILLSQPSIEAETSLFSSNLKQNGRELKVVVFVHGFQQKTLESFRHTILLSSPQDGYVPHHSARIELCQAASLDFSKKGAVFLEMLNNCLDQIRAPTSENRLFMRCDVNFDTSSYGRSFNTLIGRAAHIEFLESDTFVKFIMWSFPELFR